MKVEKTWANLDIDSIRSGDLFPVTLKNGEAVVFIATHDENGKLFFVGQLAEEHRMNPTATCVGGWAACEMRRYLNETVFALLPDDLQELITPTRVYRIDTTRGRYSMIPMETKDRLFLLSRTQVFGPDAWMTLEPEDTRLDCFGDSWSIARYPFPSCCGSSHRFYWLRSDDGGLQFYGYKAGNLASQDPDLPGGMMFGFCLS